MTGAIHLDLYLTGYRSIPVIGWLFLLQVIAAFGLAAGVLVSGSRLAAAAGAGFALSTLGGYLLSVWPPVTGTPAAGPGVTGTLGMIKRSDGATQATYNGHPLYTYIADTAPGQAHGNNLNLNGGLWHEVTVSG